MRLQSLLSTQGEQQERDFLKSVCHLSPAERHSMNYDFRELSDTKTSLPFHLSKSNSPFMQSVLPQHKLLLPKHIILMKNA